MEEIDINEAQPQINALVDRATAGESFIFTKEGKPVVTLQAYEEPKRCSRRGFMKGLMTVPDDFDTMMADEIAEMFYGPEGIE